MLSAQQRHVRRMGSRFSNFSLFYTLLKLPASPNSQVTIPSIPFSALFLLPIYRIILLRALPCSSDPLRLRLLAQSNQAHSLHSSTTTPSAWTREQRRASAGMPRAFPIHWFLFPCVYYQQLAKCSLSRPVTCISLISHVGSVCSWRVRTWSV